MPTRIRTISIVIVLVAVWGALVPFVGPSFDYGMGDVPAWTWTERRLTGHLLPGLAAILGGVMMVGSRAQAWRRLGAGVALVGGAWFIIGPVLRPAWAGRGDGMMMMGNSVWRQIFVTLGYHSGTGLVIAALSAYGLGVLTAEARPVRQSAPPVAAGAEAPSADYDREHASVG